MNILSAKSLVDSRTKLFGREQRTYGKLRLVLIVRVTGKLSGGRCVAETMHKHEG